MKKMLKLKTAINQKVKLEVIIIYLVIKVIVLLKQRKLTRVVILMKIKIMLITKPIIIILMLMAIMPIRMTIHPLIKILV